ncbi:macrolide family glycosyltransferase [Micromonospora sp. DT233]|uniref:macrolide family glycosyltransferase n=1 Tax=Micromonospora sp. DT233 TaxID=3393432 RepID=UPI003CF21224
MAADPDRKPTARAPGHVAVFTFPAYAHIAPAVPMLAELVRRGHRVTCFVVARFAELVAASGAEVVEYESDFPWADGPTGSAVEKILDFFAEAIAPVPAAVSRLADDRPDVVAHDLAASEAARIIARAWDVPVVQLCPTIASSPGFSMSQRQSLEVIGPPPEPVDPADARFAEFVARRERMLADRGLAGVSIEGFGAEHGPNIVFLPREFQLAPETFDERFTFVGPCLADAPGTGDWTPPADGRDVLLLSLGSSYTPDQAQFLRFCVDALADGPWHVVLTLGHRVRREEFGPLPGNVEAHQWLRHPQVLRHAAGFVTHGGMGSVMESLFHGVPMVLVPYHMDQRVIADRAVELDLGRVMRREETSADALRAAVQEITVDPRIRTAVERMRGHVHRAGGAVRGADAVESLIRIPAHHTDRERS